MTEELLAEAGPDLLDRLVATARSGQGDDPAAGRFIASCLLALADVAREAANPEHVLAARRAIAHHLVADPDAGVQCELHLIQVAGAGDRTHFEGLDPAHALVRAAEAAGTADIGVEVLASTGDEPAVLVLLARQGGALEYAFPPIGRAVEAPEDGTVAYAPPAVVAPPGWPNRTSASPALTTTDNTALVEALRAAIAEVSVQVDFGEVASVAERVADKLAESFRVPSAHDVADVIAPLIPTPGEVADIVSERVTERLPAVPSNNLQATIGVGGSTSVNLTHLEVELATLHDQLQAAQRSFASLADEVGASSRRTRDQHEVLTANLEEEMSRLSRRIDDRMNDLLSSRAAAATPPTAMERELRTTVTALNAAIERLDASVRRTDRASDARTLARLTRTVQVLAQRMKADDLIPIELDAPAATGDGDGEGDEPPSERTDNPLRLIGRQDDSAAG